MSLILSAAAPHHVREALQLLAGNSRLDLLATHTLPLLVRRVAEAPETLLAATRQGRLAGATWAEQVGGTSVVVWAPRLAAGEPESTATMLLEMLDRLLRERGTRIAYGLVAPADACLAERLRAAAYLHLTDVVTLTGTSSQAAGPAQTTDIQYERCLPLQRDRLVSLIEETFAGSLDCPQLWAARPAQELLARIDADPRGSSGDAYLVRHAGRDVGCVLLVDRPAWGHLELVYMGLIPAARGRCWGRGLASWSLQAAGRRELVVHVDAANLPARKAYQGAGFLHRDRRELFGKVFGA